MHEQPERIAVELAARGLRFERWPIETTAPATVDTPDNATASEALLQRHAAAIERVRNEVGLQTVDVVRLAPDHPERERLRAMFLQEHTHSEDEVRFFVEGRGLFCLHIGDEVLQVLCTRGDWIAVPAGTRHWFDMGPRPHFCALRFFGNPEGWVASFTGWEGAARYPRLDALPEALSCASGAQGAASAGSPPPPEPVPAGAP
nr:acireductone dioxygenase [Synechococcus sp. RSCCF101]